MTTTITSLVGRVLAAGALSTLTMDLCSGLAARARWTAGLSPQLIGRWFGRMLQRVPPGHTILDSPSFRGELGVALVGHYAIGITLTGIFCALIASLPAVPRPTTHFTVAVLYSLFTNGLPWLWMFPAMGFGFFGNDAPPPFLLMRTSLVNHLFFGIGVGIWTRLLFTSALR